MIRFDTKTLRPRDTVTGKFVSFQRARRSSVFRREYQNYLLRKELRLKDKRIRELEEELKKLKEEKMKWKKVEPPPPPDIKIMYDYIKSHVTKSKYEKFLDKINRLKTSDMKKQTLIEYYYEIFEREGGEEE